MFEIKKSSTQKSTAPRVKAGSYLAKIVSVEDNEKYVKGDAFIIKYNLFDHEGKMVAPFEETFFNYSRYPRTQSLLKLLKQLELKTVDKLIGKVIEVEVRYKITDYNRNLPSIVSRVPLATDGVNPEVRS